MAMNRNWIWMLLIGFAMLALAGSGTARAGRVPAETERVSTNATAAESPDRARGPRDVWFERALAHGFLFVGLYALFAHFARRRYGLSFSLWFAFTAICLGLSRLLSRNVLAEVSDPARWMEHAALLTALLFPAALWRFVEVALGPGWMGAIRRCWQLQLAVVLVIWPADVFGWAPFGPAGQMIGNGALGLQLLVGAGEGLRHALRGRGSRRVIAVGVLLFSASGLLDIGIAFLFAEKNLEWHPWGMAALIVALAWAQERAAGEAQLRLRAQSEALRAHREHLEKLVEARTAELRTATVAARAASRAKSAFLANMSHELRTPLHAILGYAQLFQRDESPAEERKARAGIIRQSGEHLLALIDDILDISKIEAGKLEIRPGETRPISPIRDAVDMIAPRARSKGLEFVFEPSDSLPDRIVTDAKRVRQLLLNLLGNAVKYTETGSVRLKALREGDRLVFRVIDTGVGIAPEYLEAIFEPFRRLSDPTASRSTPDEGAGLGLAICRNIAREMGGDVCARSVPGRGSEFRLELPCVPAEPEIAEPPARPSAVAEIRGPGPRLAADGRPAPRPGIAPSPLPPDFDRLRQAARIGDVRDVLAEAARLAARFPEQREFLDRVGRLAGDFEIKALQSLLEP